MPLSQTIISSLLARFVLLLFPWKFQKAKRDFRHFCRRITCNRLVVVFLERRRHAERPSFRHFTLSFSPTQSRASTRVCVCVCEREKERERQRERERERDSTGGNFLLLNAPVDLLRSKQCAFSPHVHPTCDVSSKENIAADH